MDKFTRYTIALDEQENRLLRELARQEYRQPRDQARFLLRNMLLQANNLSLNASNDVNIRQDSHAVAS